VKAVKETNQNRRKSPTDLTFPSPTIRRLREGMLHHLHHLDDASTVFLQLNERIS